MTKQKVNVDNLFYKETIIPIDEWHDEWEVCPIQRDHEERAQKPKHQRKFKSLDSAHLEVYGAVLTQDCECRETKKKYKKNTKFKTDGHTRDEYWWSEYSDGRIPEKVRVRWKYFDNMEDIYKEYLKHDSPDDAEIASDRVDGAYRDVFAHRGIQIKNGKLRKVEPIQYAALQCFPNKYDDKMKTSTTNIRLWVSDLEEAILWILKIFNSKEFGFRKQTKLKHVNPFTLSYLVSYLKYKDEPESLEKLKEFILRVSNFKQVVKDDEVDDNNPCNRFMEEWSQLSSGTSKYVFAAINGTEQSNNMRSFSLLMIDKFIQGESISKNGAIQWDWKDYMNKWNYAFALQQSADAMNILELVDS